MILKVNPTRINLLLLKKKLKTAKRGHKLLKDKRDGLMKKFMAIIRDVKKLREEIEVSLGDVFKSYTKASAYMSDTAINRAFMLPNAKLNLEVKEESLMSVPIPKMTLTKDGSLFSYGLMETTGDLDSAMEQFDAVLPSLITLAELEKTVENLAKEIERTRRRASALENTMIPNLNDTIRFITSRLEEQARDAVVSTMRIKAMILEKEAQMAK